MTTLIHDNSVFDGIFSKADKLPDVNTIDDAVNLFGLSPEQVNDENAIKNAYRKLAAQHHPDVNQDPDATSNFQTIQNALEIIEGFYGSYSPDTGSFTEQGGTKFNWKNDPLFQEMSERAKGMNVDEMYQTHTNVEDNEQIQKMQAAIERVKNGEGGTWEEYKGSRMVFKVDLKDGSLAQINYGNSRSKNAYRNFLNKEIGTEALQQFEDAQNMGQELFREKYEELLQSGMEKQEAIQQAKRFAIDEVYSADLVPKVPEDKLQVYRKKRITQLNYYIKKIRTELSTQQRSEELYNSEAPDAMIDILTEDQPSVESGTNLFTQMQNLGIFKVPSRGRRKGLVTVDPGAVENFSKNQNPSVAFAGGVGLLLRQYIDSTFNERYIAKFHTDPYVRSTSEGLAGLQGYSNMNVLSYPEDQRDLEELQEDFEHRANTLKRWGRQFDENILKNAVQRGIAMTTYGDRPNASEYMHSGTHDRFTKEFVAESPEHEEYAQRVDTSVRNRDIVEKNMKYYALQLAKALIKSGKADVNRKADFQIKWDEDDRSVYEKYNDVFRNFF